MKSDKLRLIIKIALWLSPVVIGYCVLYEGNYFPLLTNSISFDAKYYEIKKRDLNEKIDIIAIGSSVTLDDLNSNILTTHTRCSYYNFSSWNLQISDLDFLIKNYILHYKPKTLIVCSTINDFTSNGNLKVPPHLNLNNTLLPYVYLQNFNSVFEVVKRKKEIERDRLDSTSFTSLNFDNYGGIVLKTKKNDLPDGSLTHKLEFPTQYTSGQYQSLKNLSHYLKLLHIKLIFIQTPIKPSYVNDLIFKQKIDNHINICRSIVQNEMGNYMSFNDPILFPNKFFADDFHLNLLGSELFTNSLVESIKLN